MINYEFIPNVKTVSSLVLSAQNVTVFKSNALPTLLAILFLKAAFLKKWIEKSSAKSRGGVGGAGDKGKVVILGIDLSQGHLA